MILVMVWDKYIRNIISGPIPDGYWYKAGIVSGHTRLICYSMPIYIPISHTQVAPYISVEHTTVDLVPSIPWPCSCSSHLFLHVHEVSQIPMVFHYLPFNNIFEPPYPLVVTKVMFNLYHLRAQIRPIWIILYSFWV
jgi:hypothetical protein